LFSAYLPYDSEDPPRSKEFEKLVRYCQNENLYLVMECDSSAHHIAWGSTKGNGRGKALVEFLNSSNLEILNQGNGPTFIMVIGKGCLILPWGPLDF
jgi:hypothetical protein